MKDRSLLPELLVPRWVALSVVGRVLFAAGMLLVTKDALAGYWDITPHIEVEEAFSDNIDLAPDNERADFITAVRPGISISGTEARLDFDLEYDFERRFFLHNSEKDDDTQNLLSRGRAELLEEALFLDARASVSEQRTSTRGAVSASGLTTDEENRTEAKILSVSPSFRHHFGRWADAEARYTYTRQSFGSGGPSDSTTNRLAATVNSGRRFGPLLWKITVEGEDTDLSGGDTFLGDFDTAATDLSDRDRSTEHRLASAEFQYVFNRQFSLLARAGYERFEDITIADPPDGPIWSVGFLAEGRARKRTGPWSAVSPA